jgi:MoaA/NifB/PqqE/SkfB family radical SAM enzyme
VLLGFALTQHCNLRCPHCIRDDVTTVQALDTGLIERTLDDARHLFGTVTASFTGGEPLLHPRFSDIIEACTARRIPYRFVSNGWHLGRVLPLLDRHPPQAVRLSLSGANRETHDAERGRDSFRRVLLGVAMLTSRRIPVELSLVIDRRDRHQVAEAAELAEGLGVVRLHYILPQPVPGSVARDSDLPPEEWLPVVREIQAITNRRTTIQIDYGAPSDDAEVRCDTFALRRVYVDARGRLSTCCQLSEYGFNEADVVADLQAVSLRDVWPRYVARLRAQELAIRPTGDDALDPFPCLRCARACGKLDWLKTYPSNPWAQALIPLEMPCPV